MLALDSEKRAVALQLVSEGVSRARRPRHRRGPRGKGRDEERHVDWFEAQLGAIERVGAQPYLAQHVGAGEAPR